MGQTVPELAAAIGTLVLGVFLVFWYYRAVMNRPLDVVQFGRSWASALRRPMTDARVARDIGIGLRLNVPHSPESDFRVGQEFQQASVARVHLPLDVVSRLGSKDAWTDAYHLDGSAFVLRRSGVKSKAADVLPRLDRHELVLSGRDDMSARTRDDMALELTCHASLEVHLRHRLGATDELGNAFSAPEQWLQTVRSKADAAFGEFVNRLTYKEVFQANAQLLAELNSIAELGGVGLDARFTAAIVKPHLDGELRVLGDLIREIQRLQNEITSRQMQTGAQIRQFRQRLDSIEERVERSLNQFLAVGTRLKEAASGLEIRFGQSDGGKAAKLDSKDLQEAARLTFSTDSLTQAASAFCGDPATGRSGDGLGAIPELIEAIRDLNDAAARAGHRSAT